MAGEYLPPLVARLEADITGFAAKFAEAEALVDKFNAKLGTKMQAGGKAAAAKAATGLIDEFESTIGRSGAGTLGDFSRSLDRMFDDAGAAGGTSLLGGFDRLVGGSGGFGRVVGDMMKLGEKPVEEEGAKLGDKAAKGLLAKMKQALGPLADQFSKIGQSVSADVGGGFMQSIGQLATNPYVGPAIVGVAAALASFLGGALSAAVIGGGAISAVVAGGFIAAKTNPAVQMAVHGLGTNLMAMLTDATAPLAGPMVQAMASLEHTLGSGSSFGAGLKDMFASLAPYVTRLADALGGFVSAVGGGFESMMSHAGPVLDVLARELPNLGGAIGKLFTLIGEGAPGAAQALSIAFALINSTIIATGYVVRTLSDTFDWMTRRLADTFSVLGQVVGWLDKVRGVQHGVGQGMQDWATQIRNWRSAQVDANGVSDSVVAKTNAIAQSLLGVNVQMQTLIGDWDTLTGQMMSADEATLAAQKALIDFGASLKTNGRNWDANTAAGNANRLALDQVVDAQVAVVKQAETANSLTPAIVAAAQKRIGQALAEAKANGANASAIDAAQKAYNNLSDILGQMTSRQWVLKVTEINQVYGPPIVGMSVNNLKLRWGGVTSYANGGISSFADAGVYTAGTGSSGLIKFAEPATGGEAYIPRYGDRARNLATLATAASWMGARVTSGGGDAGGSASEVLQPVVINVDGVRLLNTLIRIAQQRKARVGATGLA